MFDGGNEMVMDRGWRLVSLLAVLLAASPGRAAFVGQDQFGSGSTIAMAWGDADGDGDLDLAVGNYGGANQLFINDGSGTFTEQTPFGSGQRTFAVVWADFDNDGDQDLAVGNGANNQNQLYLNDGSGGFTATAQFGLARTVALAWADYDRDGDLDLAVGNGILGTPEQNRLYENDGAGGFTGRDEFGVGQTDTLAWADYDDDGDLDLAVGNGGFGTDEPNALYVNQGNGTFVAQAQFGMGDTASIAWGDADNDGDLDLAVGNWNGGQNFLYVNQGNGTFTEVQEFGLRDPNTVAWADTDHDGDLDLAVGNGDFTSADANGLWVNDGGAAFTEQPELGLGSTDSIAWGDCDGDGDLDAAVGNEHTPAQNQLYLNQQNDTSYLLVGLVGHFHDRGAGYSNRDGIGARVTVYAAGHGGDPAFRLGMREVEAHGGFASQSARDAHFGLPGRAAVDVRVAWPGSAGSRIDQDLRGVAVGQRVVIDESAATDDYVLGEGLDARNGNMVRVYAADGVATPVSFQAYGAGSFGTNVAAGDVDGGGPGEILTGPGPGAVYGPQVRAFRRDGTPIAKVNFFAYGTLKYGVNPATGDLDADGFRELLSGAGPGAVFGPHVRGFDFDGGTLTVIQKINFFAYGTLKYGVNVASGDLDADGWAELVTGPGPGAVFGAQVRGFGYDGVAIMALGGVNFDAFPTFRYGANVALGDVDGDGRDEAAVAPGPGPTLPSRYLGFDLAPTTALAGFDVTPFTTLYGGRVGLGELTGDGSWDLVCGAGLDPTATSEVRAYDYDGAALAALAGTPFTPFGSSFGVNVGAGGLFY